MSALRLLALSYVASASVFVVAATAAAHPDLAREFIAGAGAMAEALAEKLHPAPPEPVVRLELTPPAAPVRAKAPPPITPPEPRQVQADDRLTAPEFSASAIIPILPDLSPESAPVPAEPKLVEPNPIAPQVRIGRAPLPPLPRTGPQHDRITLASLRLKDRLTPEMTGHFSLILYVSKAKSGPLAQHMLVVENKNGALKPIHDWTVSTGREQSEISPRGRSSFTSTPAGFYEFDPKRMYRRYRSWNWDQDMPHAMFFNWERRGVATGLAIHAATEKDIGKLGSRASAGCVHLAPEHAALLYELVRQNYPGRVPRFAYNAGTDTMSNSGNFMHDRRGRLKMIDGYKVLVMVDDYGGEDRVAELD